MIYELIWSPSEKKAFMSTKRMLSLTNKNLKKKQKQNYYQMEMQKKLTIGIEKSD